MSRIHEALKKAEQDRAMAPAAAEVGDRTSAAGDRGSDALLGN
jgi:hypothetical protein